MARTNKQIDHFAPAFDASGNVTALMVWVSYNLVDDDGDMVGRVRSKDIWPTLTPTQQAQVQTAMTRLLAASIAAF